MFNLEQVKLLKIILSTSIFCVLLHVREKEEKSRSKTNLNFIYQWKYNAIKTYFHLLFVYCILLRKEHPGYTTLSQERDAGELLSYGKENPTVLGMARRRGERQQAELEAWCSERDHQEEHTPPGLQGMERRTSEG